MTIKVECVGNRLTINPWVPELETTLTCTRRLRNDPPPEGSTADTYRRWKKYIYKKHKMFSVEIDKSTGNLFCITTGGAFSYVCNTLNVLGYIKVGQGAPPRNNTYTVIDYQEDLPPAQWGNLHKLDNDLREGQGETLARIAASHRGIIVAPTGDGKTFIITALPLVYPDLRMLVVSPGVSVTKDIKERLEDVTKELVSVQGGKNAKWYPNGRLATSTTNSLHKIPLDWPDIILFDEAHTAAAERSALQLLQYDKAKLFGFTASPEGRCDQTDKITHMLFGEIIVDISYQTSVARGNIANIAVISVHINLPDLDPSLQDTDALRYGYWLNDERNSILVEAAKQTFKRDDQVLFFVKTAEHGLRIKQLLPDVPFVHAGISKMKWKEFQERGLVDGLTYEEINGIDEDALKESFRRGDLKWAICTQIWKQAVDFPDLYGVVRLDGGASVINSIQMSGRLSRKGHDQNKHIGIVIDGYDDFGESYLRWSDARRALYKKQGWEVVDV